MPGVCSPARTGALRGVGRAGGPGGAAPRGGGAADHAPGPAEPQNVNPRDRKGMPPPFPAAPGRQEADPSGGVSPEEYTGPPK